MLQGVAVVLCEDRNNKLHFVQVLYTHCLSARLIPPRLVPGMDNPHDLSLASLGKTIFI